MHQKPNVKLKMRLFKYMKNIFSTHNNGILQRYKAAGKTKAGKYWHAATVDALLLCLFSIFALCAVCTRNMNPVQKQKSHQQKHCGET